MKFIESIDKNDYIKFAESHEKSHFLQSYGWGQFCEKVKGQVAKYVGIEDDNGSLVATCLILLKKTPFGYSYGYAPRGYLIDYNNREYIKIFTDYLKEYMKREKIIYIKFDPDISYQEIDEDANPIEGGKNNYELYNYMLDLGYKHTGFYKLYDGNQPRYTFRIDLKRPWEEIESKMSKSFLKSVKRSEQYDFIIDNDINPQEFYRLIQSNSKKDNFDARTLKHYEVLSNELANEDAIKYFNISIEPKKLVEKINKELLELKEELETNKKKQEDIKNRIAKLEKDLEMFKIFTNDKVMICSLICTYTKNRAWSFYIGSDEVANSTFAVSRAYYEAIKDAYNMGLDFFDLFGTPGDPKTSYKNLARIHEFKKKFGDQYIEFIGEFDLVNNKILYKLLPGMLKIYRTLRKLK